MIDLHSHIWDLDKHLNAGFRQAIGESFKATPAAVSDCLPATPELHWAACRKASKTVVVAFDMGHSGAIVPNDFVADYVRQHPEHLIGFASVDPQRPEALDMLRWAHADLGLRGLKLSSTYQNIHPHDKRAYALYQYCQDNGLPILVHQGATIIPQAPLSFAHPLLLEQVAWDFPDLNIIVAHLGFPWTADTIVLMRKQSNIFADISALCYRPWQLYNALLMAMEARVAHKIFFGTDWPFTTIEQTVTSLYKLCHMTTGSHFPHIPEALIDELIHTDPLPRLGLA